MHPFPGDSYPQTPGFAPPTKILDLHPERSKPSKGLNSVLWYSMKWFWRSSKCGLAVIINQKDLKKDHNQSLGGNKNGWKTCWRG